VPYIFPKRFLRNKDILHPEEFQSDVDGLTSVLDQGLDRTNFFAQSLKTLSSAETSSEPSVKSGAYYDVQKASVEVRTRMEWSGKGDDSVDFPVYSPYRNKDYENAYRGPPNFVMPDGTTFRDNGLGGSLASGGTGRKPFVIPHTGEWSVVQNTNLTGPLQTTFHTVGKAKVWVCAYVQYVWQGFYEPKRPWVTHENGDYRRVNEYEGGPHGKLDDDGNPTAWTDTSVSYSYNQVDITRRERDALNAFGPSRSWRVHLNEGETEIATDDVPFAFPLNEYKAQVEGSHPNFGGQHHISKGFYPALVQFALRIDGEIIDETITGKQFSYEESAHGLKIADGTIERTGDGEATDGVDDYFYHMRAQRTGTRDHSYGKVSSVSSAGQKIRSSRAVSMGPECMPVRLGAVVPIDSGNHTVEIVARRLSRKKNDFSVGDFVGVFSRRITSITLPIFGDTYDPRGEEFNPELFRAEPNGSLGPMESGEFSNFVDIKDRLNNIEAADVKSHSLPNTHLPSKVEINKSTFITTHKDSLTDPLRRSDGESLTPPISFRSDARFPGFMNDADKIAGSMDSWVFDETASGWDYLKDISGNLSLTPSSGEDFTPRTNQDLLIFANVEFFRVQAMVSAKAAGSSPAAFTLTEEDGHDEFRDYVSWIMTNKYLDLFALFAIGYKLNGKWYIASDTAPALVNSFNWVNRSAEFIAEEGDKLSYVYDFIEPGDPGHYGTGASEYSFKVMTDKDGWIDRRGNQTRASNCGVDIPLFAHLEGMGAGETIEEIAVFVSSTFPHFWDYRHARFGEEYSTASREVSIVTPAGTTTAYTDSTWASPWYGRGIIQGTKVFHGDAKLSILKLNK
jgi:hypothetical protein